MERITGVSRKIKHAKNKAKGGCSEMSKSTAVTKDKRGSELIPRNAENIDARELMESKTHGKA